jgi:Uma2 family endonuclease
MQQQPVAPWGEVIATDRPMTVDDLLNLPDDGHMYELVEGQLVRMLPSGGGASSLALRLGARIEAFVEQHNLGAVTGADGEFDLGHGTALAPDVAFVRAARVPPPTSPIYEKAWPLAPDLAAEVASPNQYRPAMARKAQRYLNAGTRLVWVVWPKRKEVDVWRPGDSKPSATLSVGDVLDGLDILPGFTYPLERLFP